MKKNMTGKLTGGGEGGLFEHTLRTFPNHEITEQTFALYSACHRDQQGPLLG